MHAHIRPHTHTYIHTHTARIHTQTAHRNKVYDLAPQQRHRQRYSGVVIRYTSPRCPVRCRSVLDEAGTRSHTHTSHYLSIALFSVSVSLSWLSLSLISFPPQYRRLCPGDLNKWTSDAYLFRSLLGYQRYLCLIAKGVQRMGRSCVCIVGVCACL